MKKTTMRQRRRAYIAGLRTIIKFSNGQDENGNESFMGGDLFGEIVVSQADVDLWLQRVAGLDPASPRAAWYVRAWSVPLKIAAAKAAGLWPPE